MAGRKIIVIGGGAAGMMAAGQAADCGADVTIIEKKYKPGRKLRITGKGRCNLTNSAELREFLKHFRSGNKFLMQAFNRFFNVELVEFLNRIGVETEVERGGRIFPVNNDAKLVVDAFQKWINDTGVRVCLNETVQTLQINNGRVVGLITKSNWRKDISRKQATNNYKCDAVILATGGLSYPATGSTGEGYRLANAAGHSLIPTFPSLVPIETVGDVARRLQGVSLRNVNVSLIIEGKKADEQFGEMLFTHFGLSGPIILSLSRKIVAALREKKKVSISIDLKPALDEKKLDLRLQREIVEHGKQRFKSILKELLPRKMISVCLDLIKIDPDKMGHQIGASERKRLLKWLKDFRFEISGHRGYEEAIITAGGVETREINPRTMESNIVKGLYFAGEVMDIDADTGGYNLQAAFSTGWLAGRSAAGGPGD